MIKYRNFLTGILAAATFAFVGVNAQTAPVQLEQKVQKENLRLPYYDVFDYITFDIKGNTVYLEGSVKNAINKSSIENIVEDMDGVEKVVNNIEILPLGSFDDSIRRNLVRSIANRGGISRYISNVNPPVRLIVDGGHITLEGTVATRSDSDLMNITANSVSGAFSVTNNLKIERERP